MTNGRWVRVSADLENLTLRLDNRSLSTRARSEACARRAELPLDASRSPPRGATWIFC